jgi:hypothetical protein
MAIASGHLDLRDVTREHARDITASPQSNEGSYKKMRGYTSRARVEREVSAIADRP